MLPLVNDVLQPTTWYTCPAGKVATVKGTVVCVDLGAGAQGQLDINGIRFANWGAGGGTVIQQPLDLLTGVVLPFEANLNALQKPHQRIDEKLLAQGSTNPEEQKY